jgi:CHRD domain
MNQHKLTIQFALFVLAAGIFLGSMAVLAADSNAVILSGNQEVPPVATSGSASGTIVVGMDQTVSGSISTNGVNGTRAFIHEAAQGAVGPAIITLVRSSDDTWTVPSSARLNDEQYRAYKSGNLYVNIYSDSYLQGEVRAQIKP